jgi:hypothetical protein
VAAATLLGSADFLAGALSFFAGAATGAALDLALGLAFGFGFCCPLISPVLFSLFPSSPTFFGSSLSSSESPYCLHPSLRIVNTPNLQNHRSE